MDLNRITVTKKDIVMRPCNACGTKTAHIGKDEARRQAQGLAGPTTQPFNTCLQCLVDANNVIEWSRWIDENGKAIPSGNTPRGIVSK